MKKIKKKIRQYRSNQGRSPEKMAESYKVMFIAVVMLVIITCILILN
jgi:hypothetical protein